MRRYFKVLLSVLLLLILVQFSACNKFSEEILQEDKSPEEKKLLDKNLMKNNKDSIDTLNQDSLINPFLYSCNGNGECLPVIDVQSMPPQSSTPGITIFWDITPSVDHQFYIKVSGLTNYNSTIINSGSMFFSTNEDSYKLLWEINCPHYECNACSSSGAYIKKSNEDEGSIGSFTDCQKEYLSYRPERSYHSRRIITIECVSPSWMEEDEDNYLKADEYKIFKKDYGQPPILETSGSFIADVTEIYLPNEPLQNYEVKLYSSDCEYSDDEHFLNKSYQGDGGSGYDLISPYVFQKNNAHPNSM